MGSFSAAANSLGLTQPGISRQIQQLEREVGVTLVDREQRPVLLTQAGREFLASAEMVVNELEAAMQRIAAVGGRLAGTFYVAASTIPGEYLVPGLLARFTSLYPLVRPSLVITDSTGVAEEVLAKRAQVGFLGARLESRRLKLIPFSEDEIVLVAPENHHFAGRRSIALNDLEGYPFVEREGGSGTLESLKRLLEQQGLRLPEHRVAMVAGTSQAQLAAIEAGVGIGFVSSLVLSSRAQSRVVRVGINGVELKRTLYLAHENAHLSPITGAFVQFAAEYGA